MQPHAPFIRSALSRGEFKEYEAHPFRYLKNGGNMEVVWEAYLDNLRFALDHVGRLIDNYDGERTVITADHGDLFGEWGLYSHNCGILHPNLRRVPWVETTATDRKSSNPDNILEGYETIDNDTMTVDDRLDALGYR